MIKKLNDFQENELTNMIANIRLYNSEVDKSADEKKLLTVAIKKNVQNLNPIFGSIKLTTKNIIDFPKTTEDKNIDVSIVVGVDLYTQMISQGLYEYVDCIDNNITVLTDGNMWIMGDDAKKPSYLFKGFISEGYAYIPELDLSLRGSIVDSILTDNKRLDIFMLHSGFMYIIITEVKTKTKKEKEII